METASFATPDAEIAALRALLAERDALLLNTRLEVEQLKVLLARARREQYGKSFERLATEVGQRAAIIYTIAETAKLNGHNPELYIATVLDRLAKGHLASKIDDLLPWNLSTHDQSVAVS